MSLYDARKVVPALETLNYYVADQLPPRWKLVLDFAQGEFVVRLFHPSGEEVELDPALNCGGNVVAYACAVARGLDSK